MKTASATRKLRGSVAPLLFALSICISIPAASQTHIWSKSFGDVSADFGLDVLLTPSNDTWVVGGFQGSVSFGGGLLVSNGALDGFLARYDNVGAYLVDGSFGTVGGEVVAAVAVDGAGNTVFVGYFSNTLNFGGLPLISAGSLDIFVAKFSSAGAHIWSMNFGDAGAQLAREVVIDAFDNIIFTGYAAGTVDFGGGVLPTAGSNEAYVASLNSAGGHNWSRSFSGTSTDEGNGVAVDAAGNVVVTGRFSNTVDFGGGALVSAGSFEIYVARYSTTGMHIWSKRYGGTSSDIGNAVAVDDAGSVLITGHVGTAVDLGGGVLPNNGVSDIFVLKLDAAGNHIWSRTMGGLSSDHGVGVAVDSNKTVFVTGYFSQAADFGGGNITAHSLGIDMFLARYDAAGNHLYSDGFGISGIDKGDAVSVGVGIVSLVGTATSTIDFGGGVLGNNGQDDIVVAAFSIPPVIAIQSIEDIGNDQGGSVRINFTRADEDALGASTPVLRYEAFRRIEALPVGTMMLLQQEPPITSAQASTALTGWEFVGMVPAHGEDNYSIVVSTLADSTITSGSYLTSFFLRAATAGPLTYFDSAPDSGFSLDNLAPGVPASLVVSIGDLLSWDPVGAADWKHYTIYGGATDDFDLATKITATIATELDVQSSPSAVYFVTATDFSGNEGLPGMTESPTSATPGYFSKLGVNVYPNPFNPSTTIEYTIPTRGKVWVEIHDVQGKLVDRLANGVTREPGRYTLFYQPALSAGIYFLTIRTSTSDERVSEKLVLVK